MIERQIGIKINNQSQQKNKVEKDHEQENSEENQEQQEEEMIKKFSEPDF